jgi:hypothetical protein
VTETRASFDLDLDLGLPPPFGRGMVSASRRAAYDAAIVRWCQGIKQVWRQLDFEIGTREWCYLMEPHGLAKDDFDRAEVIIVKCRKEGLLPLNIVAEDESRAAVCLEKIDEKSPDAEALSWVDYIIKAHESYTPVSFWDFQDRYVEMVVEKLSLRNLFQPECEEFHVPIFNSKGAWDMNSRASMLRRFAKWQEEGKECVLLNCGDFDVGGLTISNALRSNLRAMLPALAQGGVFVDIDAIVIDRFGLWPDFIEEQGLTWIEGLSTGNPNTPNLEDPGHHQHNHKNVQEYLALYGARKVEASALVVRPEAGRALCRAAILRYVDETRIPDFEAAMAGGQELVAAEIRRLLRERWA